MEAALWIWLAQGTGLVTNITANRVHSVAMSLRRNPPVRVSRAGRYRFGRVPGPRGEHWRAKAE